MAYLLGFQMQWLNQEDAIETVNIYDRESGTGTTTFTQLEGADDPCHIFIVDNNESKFTPIRAKQAEIKFNSTATENLNTFIGSNDNRWEVEKLTGTEVKFRGFLVIDDLDEDFLDSDASNVVTLIATDNIGLLKDEPLTKTDGTNPRGYFSIIQYIAWCLQKTGLNLPINVVHNVKEQNDSTRIMYESCFLEAKTFEDQPNVSVDSYQALTSILSNDATLSQENGEWWIIRIDELQADSSINNRFAFDASSLGTEPWNKTQVIDPVPEILYFTNKTTFVKAQGLVKNVKLTFPYESPLEAIDNIDFDRGTFNGVINHGPGWEAYIPDDWTQRKGYGTLSVTPNFSAYIAKRMDNGYEKERYLVLTSPPSNAPNNRLESNPVPIGDKDKFNISVDFRWAENRTLNASATFIVMMIRLIGDDGTFWSVDPAGKWWQAGSANFSDQFRTIQHTWDGQDDESKDWITKSVMTDPAPTAGDLYVDLYTMNQLSDSYDNVSVYYSNLQFEYQAYINGTYQKYRSQYHKVSGTAGTKKVYEETVSISDSPRKLFKGALFRYNGSKYVLADLFYDGKQFTGSVPSDIYLHPFGFNQAYAVWNQYNRPFRLFDFQLQGLSTKPDITHKYTINENSAHTNNKVFMMLHFDQDHDQCEWKGVMMEVFDTTIPKDYDSAHEFKYVGDR
jgi:hypothetical protein